MAYRPGAGQMKNLLFKKNKGKERQQYIKCFFFNETNPKDVQSGSSGAVHKHGGNRQTNETTRPTGALAQDQAGLAARRVSPRRHRGRRHRAGHRGGGHRLLLALPQAGLQVYVHVFMNVTFSLQV